jgi:hypothetical protein
MSDNSSLQRKLSDQHDRDLRFKSNAENKEMQTTDFSVLIGM